jgi:hypothetical protein
MPEAMLAGSPITALPIIKGGYNLSEVEAVFGPDWLTQ